MLRTCVEDCKINGLDEAEIAEATKVADDLEEALKEEPREVRAMLSGDLLCSIPISAKTTLGDAKRLVAESTGIPECRQSLIVAGKKARRVGKPLDPKRTAGDAILLLQEPGVGKRRSRG